MWGHKRKVGAHQKNLAGAPTCKLLPTPLTVYYHQKEAVIVLLYRDDIVSLAG